MAESLSRAPAIVGAMLTDTGLVRGHNEDSVAYLLPTSTSPGIALVADGMGGHAAGEVASAIAAETVLRVFNEAADQPSHRLARAFEAANQAIRGHVAAHPETTGMGTTCTALAFADGAVWLGHIGDSRAYRHRNGILAQISEDHSLVADLVRQGALTPAEAETSPEKNIILRALGIDEQIDPQIPRSPIDAAPGDILLLCSDGLSDLVSSDQISDILVNATDLPDAAHRLIEAAHGQGAHDNISVGLFRIQEESRSAGTAMHDTRETSGIPS